jgi:small-conductance mechanosensitive channel
MVLEDQYGVGDVVDLGEASGVVEGVGLRVTTVRDASGTVWYVRNGEVMRVGNKTQGYAVAVVDLPLAHTADITKATEIAGRVAGEVTASETLAEHVLSPPEVLGVESVTTAAITLRLTVRVRAGQQWAVQRALLAKIMEAFDDAGIHAPYPNGQPA